MYGYVVPVKGKLMMQDFVLYRAFYCGICKTIGKMYGQFPRFTTNYDITFLSVLLHDCLTQEVKISEKTCILNPFKKKPIVERNDLLDKLAAANILLSYYKAKDDVIDGGGAGKRTVKGLLKKSFVKAKAKLPEIEEIIRLHYETLNRYEKEKFEGLDPVSHCFADLLAECAKNLLGDAATEDAVKLCYNVGKFVYLIDALDDVDEDFKKKRYNPLLIEYKNYKNRVQFIEDNKVSLEFILNVTINRAIECFNSLRLTQSNTLLENIVYYGLRDKSKEVLGSVKKLKAPKI